MKIINVYVTFLYLFKDVYNVASGIVYEYGFDRITGKHKIFNVIQLIKIISINVLFFIRR